MKFLALLCTLVLSFGCDNTSETILSEDPPAKDSTIAIPLRFIASDYIELSTIERISKFRSGIGHDYRDDAESCRSMKHYYQPKMSTQWSSVKIFSPVSGVVVRTFDEWTGTQLQIQPFTAKMYTIALFHVALLRPLNVGDTVIAGAQIGTHIGSQTMSDIAVFRSDGNKRFALSYFDLMSDSLFDNYKVRGISLRGDLIITKSARDADPLNCSGESFGSSGTIENWVTLN